MKAITSKEVLLKKLKKYNLIFNGSIFYLSDFHSSKCSNVLSNKLIQERVLEPTKAMSSWFEKEWRIRKPTGEHEGVNIFFDNQRSQFFFRVKKGVYDLDTYQHCVDKINYLKKLGEPLI